jgi:hypothetical protein
LGWFSLHWPARLKNPWKNILLARGFSCFQPKRLLELAAPIPAAWVATATGDFSDWGAVQVDVFGRARIEVFVGCDGLASRDA